MSGPHRLFPSLPWTTMAIHGPPSLGMRANVPSFREEITRVTVLRSQPSLQLAIQVAQTLDFGSSPEGVSGAAADDACAHHPCLAAINASKPFLASLALARR